MKLLNIEDSEIDYELMLHHLKKGGITDIYSERIETEERLREALAREKWNLVISDYNVPGFSPMTALGIVRENSKHLPFIVVSGLVGEESVADMMKAGVEDFVIKSRLERLTPVVKRAIREYEIHEQEMKSRAIAKKALEAKEGVKIGDITQTYATVTLQNYFRMYHKLSGMTGTAKTEEEEFIEIYNMRVIEIPTNRPVIRIDESDPTIGFDWKKD